MLKSFLRGIGLSKGGLNPKFLLWRTQKSRFARNLAMLASGTAGAHAITMAFSPLITRLYGPEAFGVFGTFIAIVALATPIAALSYPIAIVLPRADRDALGIVRLSLLVSFFGALLVGALLWLQADWLLTAINAATSAFFLFLLPVAILFAAWLQITQHWLIRKREFSMLARIAVTQSLVINSAKAGVGWMHPTAASLILLSAAGSLLHALLMLAAARRQPMIASRLLDQEKSTTLVKLAAQYSDFPKYRAPQNFISAGSQGIPILVLAAMVGPAAAGFYTLTRSVLSLPVTLIAKSFGDVFYPHVARAHHDGSNISAMVIQATFVLAIVGAVPFGLVIIFGPPLFEIVFGAEWQTAGQYAQWLALFYFFKFINRPTVAALPVLGLQKALLIWELLSFVVRAVALIATLTFLQSALAGIAAYAITGAVAYLMLIVWVQLRPRNHSQALR